MRLHEKAHQIDYILAELPDEQRVVVLGFVAAGYAEGKRIQRNDRMEMLIRCADCPNFSRTGCGLDSPCSEIPVH